MAKPKAAAAAAEDTTGKKWIVRAGSMPDGEIIGVGEDEAEANAIIDESRKLGRGPMNCWLQPFEAGMVPVEDSAPVEKKD